MTTKPFHFKLITRKYRNAPIMKKSAYTWAIDRVIEDREEPLRIFIKRYFPARDLGNGLNIANVTAVLNAGACFGFDYTPQEMDVLYLYITGKRGDLSYSTYIFYDGAWEDGDKDPTAYISVTLALGFVELG